MIVADASAGVAALLRPGSARDHFASDAVHAPHLIDSEVANALRRATLSGEVSAGDATIALLTWARLGIARHGASGLLPRVWELRDNLSAHDATYAALAEALQCPLVTSDGRLAGAPGVRCEVHVLPR